MSFVMHINKHELLQLLLSKGVVFLKASLYWTYHHFMKGSLSLQADELDMVMNCLQFVFFVFCVCFFISRSWSAPFPLPQNLMLSNDFKKFKDVCFMFWMPQSVCDLLSCQSRIWSPWEYVQDGIHWEKKKKKVIFLCFWLFTSF